MAQDETISCCTSDMVSKNIRLDFLYLDLDSCERCGSAASELDEAVAEVKGVLDTLGFTLSVNRVKISSLELAEKHRFVSSPTIRVNGWDISVDLAENSCEDCSDLCGSDVDCRVFEYGDAEYNAPPKAMIVDAVIRAMYQPTTCVRGTYNAPNNLETFFRVGHDPDRRDEKHCSLYPSSVEGGENQG